MGVTAKWVLAAFAVVAMALAGCGGRKGPSSPDSPVISNLTAAFTSCAAPGREFGRRLEFDYADPNGDVRGGHVEVRIQSQEDTLETFNVALPSDNATITGTTSGRIATTVCLRPIPIADERARVRLFDAAGNGSNESDVEL